MEKKKKKEMLIPLLFFLLSRGEAQAFFSSFLDQEETQNVPLDDLKKRKAEKAKKKRKELTKSEKQTGLQRKERRAAQEKESAPPKAWMCERTRRKAERKIRQKKKKKRVHEGNERSRATRRGRLRTAFPRVERNFPSCFLRSIHSSASTFVFFDKFLQTPLAFYEVW